MGATIITAKMDDESFQKLNSLRQKHFPKQRNFLQAHITLFHKLPESFDLDPTNLPTQPLPAEFTEPYFMGFGTAIEVRCPKLSELRAQMKNEFSEILSRQDLKLKKFHVTIQNKVPANQAKAFFQDFKSQWSPFSGEIIGLLIHEYLDGPWRLKKELLF